MMHFCLNIVAPYITERQKHVQTMLDADVLLQKHGLHNEKCSEDDFEENICLASVTLANDGTSCLLPKKHGFRDERTR